MKPLEFWEMEDVFILTGIAILIVGILAGFLCAWLQEKENEDNE